MCTHFFRFLNLLYNDARKNVRIILKYKTLSTTYLTVAEAKRELNAKSIHQTYVAYDSKRVYRQKVELCAFEPVT